MTPQAVPATRFDPAALGFVACCIAAAAMVAWMSVRINHERACALRESVAQAWCAPVVAGSMDEADMLRARIARNPGDANAYTELALADESAAKVHLVAVASTLAPREPNLMLSRAAEALGRQDWAAAVPPLVELLERRELPIAAQALAQLVQNGHAALLQPYVVPGTQWLARMLAAMRSGPTPFSGALPLVIQGLKNGVIEPEAARGYVGELKRAGAWGDAYALWLSLHGKSVPLLFNASFDRAFELDGFDWEVPAQAKRPGVIVERRRSELRGAVLDLQLTGRAITVPIVRQYLLIAPGRYRLRGDHLARQLRMEEGLTWRVRCGTSTAGMSGPLRDTLGLWQPFEFEFVVPPSCGIVASLQLEPTSTTEATLGGRGRMSFDAFSLERTGP